MTRPVFVAEPALLEAAEVGSALTISGAEGRHAATVRRIDAGEVIDVVDGRGSRATGEVVETTKTSVTMSVGVLEHEPAPTPRFVLVQALAKGDRDLRAVESATELGVDAIVPWQARRSIVVWRGERAENSRRKWADVAQAAMKQSRRSWLPQVAPVANLDHLTELVRTASAAFVLHEQATDRLADQSIPDAGDVLVVVGPEGGITDDEVAQLAHAGAQPVQLGQSVLRSSSAGPAALAVLSAMSRWRTPTRP